MSEEVTVDSMVVENPGDFTLDVPQFFEAALPSLVILEQTPPPTMEPCTSSNQERAVHVIVKNIPFNMRLGLQYTHPNGPALNLNHLMFDGKLLYDTPENKEVDYVSVRPVEIRRFVKQESDEISLQLRIKVLSSHHENLCFVVKVLALNPITGQEFHPLSVISEPIRVISKPERKRLKPPAPPKPTPPKKRKIDDRIKDSLAQIVDQQSEQEEIILNLYQRLMNPSNANPSSPAPPIASAILTQSTTELLLAPIGPMEIADVLKDNPAQAITSPNSFDFWVPPSSGASEFSKQEDSSSLESSSFSNAFGRFLFLYSTLTADDRHMQIRKLIRNSSQREIERISLFLDILATDGVRASLESGCACAVCPYKSRVKEFEQEQFAFGVTDDDDVNSFYNML